MRSSKETFINFYNPPSTTPVHIDNSHYTADPPIFPLPTHHLYCPHCQAQHEPLFTRISQRSPAVGYLTTTMHSSASDHTVA